MRSVLGTFKVGEVVPPGSKFLSFCWKTNRAVYEVTDATYRVKQDAEKNHNFESDDFVTKKYTFNHQIPDQLVNDLFDFASSVDDARVSKSIQNGEITLTYRGTGWHHRHVKDKFGTHIFGVTSVKS